MPYDHHLVGLYDLLTEEVNKLEVLLPTFTLHGRQEDLVVCLGQVEAWEQIWDDPIEQRDVVGQELGQVHVNDRAQQLHRNTNNVLDIRL